MKANSFTIGIICLFALSFVSCNDDDDNLAPITLTDHEGTTILMTYRGLSSSGYSYPLEGGDGNYSVQSQNDEIVTAEMISAIDFKLSPVSIGETTVTITDKSQNILILDIKISYETHTYAVKQHDIMVIGDDLTTNEKKAIGEKYLAEIPVKVGGGYQFIFSDMANGKGEAFIYEDNLSSYRIETTFEVKQLEDFHIPETSSWGYEVTIHDEKRTLVLGRYHPSGNSTRGDLIVPMALIEDITQKVQEEYPQAELVYISQVIQ